MGIERRTMTDISLDARYSLLRTARAKADSLSVSG